MNCKHCDAELLENSKLDFAVIEGVFDKNRYGNHLYKKERFLGICGKDHPFAALLGHPAVCLTPHMAWGAAESRQRCMDEIGENIRSFLAGEQRNRVV